ncbi:MAG: hypothetical protein ACHQWU_09075 [Gemmatimonadales bacterium]
MTGHVVVRLSLPDGSTELRVFGLGTPAFIVDGALREILEARYPVFPPYDGGPQPFPGFEREHWVAPYALQLGVERRIIAIDKRGQTFKPRGTGWPWPVDWPRAAPPHTLAAAVAGSEVALEIDWEPLRAHHPEIDRAVQPSIRVLARGRVVAGADGAILKKRGLVSASMRAAAYLGGPLPSGKFRIAPDGTAWPADRGSPTPPDPIGGARFVSAAGPLLDLVTAGEPVPAQLLVEVSPDSWQPDELA